VKVKSLLVGILTVVPLSAASPVLAFPEPSPPNIDDWMPASIDRCTNSPDIKLRTICIKTKTQILNSELEREKERGCLYEEEGFLFFGHPISEECKQRLAAMKKRQAEYDAKYRCTAPDNSLLNQ
jgi:hypothetical protein